MPRWAAPMLPLCHPFARPVWLSSLPPSSLSSLKVFCEDLARQNTVPICPSSSYSFGVVTYGFQSLPWCPKGHYLGRCTVCLGTSAHRPCFDPSVHHFSVHLIG
jgi:hypothetical protein